MRDLRVSFRVYRAAVNTAREAYDAIADAGTRAEVAAAKAKLDAAQKALDYPKITFSTSAANAKESLDKIWANGSGTKRVANHYGFVPEDKNKGSA